jgi:acetylornithine deacetylase/succinyl-diaminopimelate desuccinylase-like protein
MLRDASGPPSSPTSRAAVEDSNHAGAGAARVRRRAHSGPRVRAGPRRVLVARGLRRIHGNDERIALDNMRAGVRSYTEMLLDFAGP